MGDVFFKGAWKLISVIIFFFSVTIVFAFQSAPLSLPLTVGISLVCMLITAFSVGELVGIMVVIQTEQPELPELTDIPPDAIQEGGDSHV